jgi:hypothetical protein
MDRLNYLKEMIADGKIKFTVRARTILLEWDGTGEGQTDCECHRENGLDYIVLTPCHGWIGHAFMSEHQLGRILDGYSVSCKRG